MKHWKWNIRLVTLFLLVASILLWARPFQTAQAQSAAPFRVYLTFEDGPTDAYTPQILDILAQYGAKATFFPSGSHIAGHEEILRRILREGHALGNHLVTEPAFYSGTPDADVIAAYTQAEDAIRAALGDQLPVYDAQVKLFRQPGGGARPLPSPIGDNVITYNWSVDSDDCGWMIDTSENYDSIVINNIIGDPITALGTRWNVWEHGDGSVIAFHDINRVTGRVLPTILDALVAQGATFEKLPRPFDQPGTMPIVLGAAPDMSRPGYEGFTLKGDVLTTSRIRSTPSLDGHILFGSVQLDTTLLVTGRTDGWIQVQFEGQTGWMAANLLDITGPIPNLPRR